MSSSESDDVYSNLRVVSLMEGRFAGRVVRRRKRRSRKLRRQQNELALEHAVSELAEQESLSGESISAEEVGDEYYMSPETAHAVLKVDLLKKIFSFPDLIVTHNYERPYHPKEIAISEDIIPMMRDLIGHSRLVPRNLTDHQIVEFLNLATIPEVALRRMEEHYAKKNLYPNLFHDRDPTSEGLLAASHILSISPWPVLNNDGYQIIHVRVRSPDLLKQEMENCCKFLAMAVETLLICTGLYLGQLLVLDVSNLRQEHFGPDMIPRFCDFIKYFQNGIPINIERIYLLNRNLESATEHLFQYMCPLISEEVNHLVQKSGAHRSYVTNLLEYFEPTLLPCDFGGTLDDLCQYEEIFMDKIVLHKAWFAEEEQKRIDHNCIDQ